MGTGELEPFPVAQFPAETRKGDLRSAVSAGSGDPRRTRQRKEARLFEKAGLLMLANAYPIIANKINVSSEPTSIEIGMAMARAIMTLAAAEGEEVRCEGKGGGAIRRMRRVS